MSHFSMARTFLVALTAATIATGAVSCSTEEEIDPVATGEDVATYVAELPASDAVIAISIAGDAAVAYVCGGEATFATRTKWFRGVVDPSGSTAELVAADGARITLTVDPAGGAASGTIDDAGARQDVTLLATGGVAAGDLRGLYTVVDGGCRTGVVVLGDASSPRVQGTWCRAAADGGAIFAQVTPILPVALADGGLRVRVRPPGEADVVLVTRALDPEALPEAR